EKALEEFYSNSCSKDGKHSSCKECVKERSRLWRASNPKPKKPRKKRARISDTLPKGTSRCSRCKEVKEFKMFHKNRARDNGHSSYCKMCTREWGKARRKKANRPDLEVRRIWRESNRERIREQDKAYRENNRGTRALNESRRRARKKALPDTFDDNDLKELLEVFDNSCSICLEEYEHLDHFVPLSTEKVGTVKGNMVPMCAKCNTSKSDKNPFVWAESLPEYERENFDALVVFLAESNGIM